MTETPYRPPWQSRLLQKHQLGQSYPAATMAWLAPLAQLLAAHQNSAERPMLVALNGCQGSGKTTVADFLCQFLVQECGVEAIALSLDDFYLAKAERARLALSVHPLLATRGVPGTHDMALLDTTLQQLLDPQRHRPVAIPQFVKRADDRLPSAEWLQVTGPIKLVLLEGWCLGARPVPTDSLFPPINSLEREQDAAGQWRQYSNTVLRDEFPTIYARIDQWIMLRAPSFESVFTWRGEQEQKLAQAFPSSDHHAVMDENALSVFIQHFERITRRCLADLPGRVNHLYQLNAQRQVTDYHYRQQVEVDT